MEKGKLRLPLFFSQTHGERESAQMVNANQTRTGRQRGSASQGFTLIELLIVVAIILIIAAIAIPNFLRSRMAANEAAAASNLRSISTATVVYNTTWDNGFPPTLAALGGPGPVATCDFAVLLDPVLTAAPNIKSGYRFAYSGQGAPVAAGAGCGAPGFEGYLATAVPIKVGMTGQRSFCSDTPGVIHYDVTGSAIGSIATCDALPILQ
jgi:type IV pilus assembly protein PilA